MQDSTQPVSSSGRGRWPGLALVGLASLAVAAVALVLYFRREPSLPPPPASPPQSAEELQLTRGKELYENHCTQCHGDRGDGNGPAARFLYPRPRNFQLAVYLLVSTDSNLPTEKDLMQVITNGMPGSAMFPFGHLPDDDRQALVKYVQHLTRKGVEESLRRQAEEAGLEVDPAELALEAAGLTQPGSPLEAPAELPPADAGALARGREQYTRLCANCHGTTGKGDGQEAQRNSDGTPTRPRDFTRGIFKGGRDPENVYRRIMRGMPGSPMPGHAALKPGEIGDIVHFILSLSDADAPARVQHQRTSLTAKRVQGTLADPVADEAWQGARPVSVVVSPLWWRDYVPPELEVRALHDGQTLALRLTWLDGTRDDVAVRPQDFPDMASVALYRGSPEPFLGMGGAKQAVDFWLWNAVTARTADLDAVYPNLIVDTYPFEKAGGQDGPPALARQPEEFLTARAVGNRGADPTRDGDSLQARGFGTLTMRPRGMQAVRATGHRQDDRWTVVLRRPLKVDAGAGLTLAPGDRVSITYALWDGAAGDRNGQKLVSVWHDLQLE